MEIMQNDLFICFIVLACSHLWLAHLNELKCRQERKILASALFFFLFKLLNALPYEVGLDFGSQVWCKPQSLPVQRPFGMHEANVFF